VRTTRYVVEITSSDDVPFGNDVEGLLVDEIMGAYGAEDDVPEDRSVRRWDGYPGPYATSVTVTRA
jgi:hypothetical protein